MYAFYNVLSTNEKIQIATKWSSIMIEYKITRLVTDISTSIGSAISCMCTVCLMCVVILTFVGLKV